MWAHLWESCRVGPCAMGACYWSKLEQLQNNNNFNVTFIIIFLCLSTTLFNSTCSQDVGQYYDSPMIQSLQHHCPASSVKFSSRRLQADFKKPRSSFAHKCLICPSDWSLIHDQGIYHKQCKTWMSHPTVMIIAFSTCRRVQSGWFLLTQSLSISIVTTIAWTSKKIDSNDNRIIKISIEIINHDKLLK